MLVSDPCFTLTSTVHLPTNNSSFIRYVHKWAYASNFQVGLARVCVGCRMAYSVYTKLLNFFRILMCWSSIRVHPYFLSLSLSHRLSFPSFLLSFSPSLLPYPSLIASPYLPPFLPSSHRFTNYLQIFLLRGM